MLDILESLEQHNEEQAILIFLDAKKAFDNLSFLVQSLGRYEFWGDFIKWVRLIYTLQKAQMIVHGDLTNM